ncbi:hypothetical protein C8Q76DRAFT_798977 [Earliella scabrosa]|nr:hypothetical protein C8Q76DRAFT_798977 [Earliella scabrosa]
MSTSNLAVSLDKLVLPSLDEPYDPTTHKLKTFEVIIDRRLTINRLKDYLADYGLPKSGRNRGVLLERLRDFSSNPQRWPNQFQPARNPERGSISDKRAAHSEVARLIEEQFGATEKQTVHQPKRKGKARELHEPPSLPPRVIDANTAWADEALHQLNKQGDTSNGNSAASQSDSAPSGDESLTDIRRVERRIVSLDETVRSMQSQLSRFCSVTTSTTPSHPISTPPVANMSAWSESTSSPSHHALAGNPSDIEPPSQSLLPSSSRAAVPLYQPGSQHHASAIPDSCIPAEHLRYFELDGETFAFDKSQVPNPPGIAFSDDLSRLFQEWHRSSLLVVNGRGIPLKHWPWFYKRKTGIKPEVWKVIRMKWNNWKFIVKERERFPTEDAFWAVYSDNGTRFNMQRILDLLQGSRMSNSARDAQAARKFFNKNLADPRAHGYFLYKKTNTVQVMKQDATVARQWCKLLQDYPDIAEAWEDMQDEEEAGELGSA